MNAVLAEWNMGENEYAWEEFRSSCCRSPIRITGSDFCRLECIRCGKPCATRPVAARMTSAPYAPRGPSGWCVSVPIIVCLLAAMACVWAWGLITV